MTHHYHFYKEKSYHLTHQTITKLAGNISQQKQCVNLGIYFYVPIFADSS